MPRHLGTYTGPIAIGIRAEEPSPLVTLNIGGAEITIGIYEGEHINLDNHQPTQRHAAVTVSRADLVKAGRLRR
ncbi:hypothetical protein, partial [Actinacidiphila oryziradicis]|uniref:hypothetical protein n=1 Tax=Actinacidiphila oryziradicis TaxID=2571141 RepID=UPI001FEA1DB9